MAKSASGMLNETFWDKLANVIDLEQYEVPDRLIAQKFIKPHHRVLELGARYGTVSCCINALLSDPRSHVVVEPDYSLMAALQANREAHGARFRVFFGAISNVPLALLEEAGEHPFPGLGNSTIRHRPGMYGVPITSVRLLQRDHDLQFNALVADCEGALEVFFVRILSLLHNSSWSSLSGTRPTAVTTRASTKTCNWRGFAAWSMSFMPFTCATTRANSGYFCPRSR